MEINALSMVDQEFTSITNSKYSSIAIRMLSLFINKKLVFLEIFSVGSIFEIGEFVASRNDIEFQFNIINIFLYHLVSLQVLVDRQTTLVLIVVIFCVGVYFFAFVNSFIEVAPHSDGLLIFGSQ